jgi:hypothetical protein
VARLLGMGLAIGLYVTVLVAATQITGADAAAARRDGVAAMGVTSQAEPVAEPRRLGDRTESPLLTLAIAGAAIAAAGGYRLASVARRPRPAVIPVRGRRVSIST